MKITEYIYQISSVGAGGDLSVNMFLLVDNSLTLVDTGFPGSSQQILKEISQLGYTPSDITNIIITHFHGDHTGSLAPLKEATGAAVLAHAADAPYIDGRLPQPEPARPQQSQGVTPPAPSMKPDPPVAVDVLVKDGDELPMLGGTRVVHTPGHTPGSICLLIPRERVFIAGDILGNFSGISLPPEMFTLDMAQEIESVKRVASLDFDIICFSHGSPILNKAREAVNSFVNGLDKAQQV
jgi:glyoxylase-like metal-dependent hydrolase (beta-lactamase superfamily II)